MCGIYCSLIVERTYLERYGYFTKDIRLRLIRFEITSSAITDSKLSAFEKQTQIPYFEVHVYDKNNAIKFSEDPLMEGDQPMWDMVSTQAVAGSWELGK